MNEMVVKPRELPTSFDSRQKWPDFIHPIQDQGDCARYHISIIILKSLFSHTSSFVFVFSFVRKNY